MIVIRELVRFFEVVLDAVLFIATLLSVVAFEPELVQVRMISIAAWVAIAVVLVVSASRINWLVNGPRDSEEEE